MLFSSPYVFHKIYQAFPVLASLMGRGVFSVSVAEICLSPLRIFFASSRLRCSRSENSVFSVSSCKEIPPLFAGHRTKTCRRCSVRSRFRGTISYSKARVAKLIGHWVSGSFSRKDVHTQKIESDLRAAKAIFNENDMVKERSTNTDTMEGIFTDEKLLLTLAGEAAE